MGCGKSKTAAGANGSYLLVNPKVEKRVERGQYREDGGTTTLSVAAVSMQGWRKTMEDVCFFRCNDVGICMLGVFDGHSGAAASKFASENLLGCIQTTAEWGRGDIKGACTKGFIACDAAIRSQGITAGTTAVLGFVLPEKIIVANCGDSRAVLSRAGKQLPMSIDHKPSRKCEVRRIQRCGGTVDYSDPSWPRIICPPNKMSIACSRALGDHDFKTAESSPEEQIVSCCPEFYERDRSIEDELLLLGTDGIWDVMTSPEVVGLMSVRSQKQDIGAAASDLIDCCFSRGSMDNMTLVAIDLRQNQKLAEVGAEEVEVLELKEGSSYLS
ncbi:unnamed protein product [Chrysoparadoxa australica]